MSVAGVGTPTPVSSIEPTSVIAGAAATVTAPSAKIAAAVSPKMHVSEAESSLANEGAPVQTERGSLAGEDTETAQTDRDAAGVSAQDSSTQNDALQAQSATIRAVASETSSAKVKSSANDSENGVQCSHRRTNTSASAAPNNNQVPNIDPKLLSLEVKTPIEPQPLSPLGRYRPPRPFPPSYLSKVYTLKIFPYLILPWWFISVP